MPLVPGARLGAYEALALLGAGGMGEVYKARDTRLGRSVALKILHAHVAADPLWRRRFEREARAISQLNHPRICTLYDVGEEGSSQFLVMEFVEGETLAHRLKKGPLPIDVAVRHAIEVAEGLDHAHRAGITHRDLKPANVMLTRSGAKLLDFGVAKLREEGAEVTRSLDRAVNELEQHPNQPLIHSRPTGLLTDVGIVLGTFEYMAPEQLQGHEVDARTDIFGFGVVLYEALTGRKPFEASTQAGLIGAILMSDPPPMSTLRPAVPPLLELVVQRCLAKDPDERWQTVRDLIASLRWVKENTPLSLPPGARQLPRMSQAAIGAVVVAILTSGAMFLRTATRPERDSPLERWDVALPTGHSLAAELVPSLALSSDGNHLVYRAQSGTGTQLYVRHLDQFEARLIQGSVDAHTPFFAPDGQSIGFMANARIFRVPTDGGPPEVICDAPSLTPGSPGATWGPDGTIVFAAGTSGLMYVSSAGGIPETLTMPDSARGEVTHISPQFLPGGKELLFTIRTVEEGWRLAILSMMSRQWQWLPPIGEVGSAKYVPSGHILYAQSGRLHAIPVNLAGREFTGPSFGLSEEVYTRVVTDALLAEFAVADTGIIAFVSGRPPDWTLVSVGMDGRTVSPLADAPHMYRYPRFSPDGLRVAVTVEEERTDLYIADDRGSLRKLTNSGNNITPTWHPSGRLVTFGSRRAGSLGFDIYSAPIDESAEAERIVSRPGTQVPSGWSPRGDALAFYELGNQTARDVWIWSAREPSGRPLLSTRANERAATFSPNGNWLTYVSNETGLDEVYVQRYPGPGGKEIVSRGGGTEPVWSPNGRELFYRNKGQMMVVTLRTDSGLVADTPRVLFQDHYVTAPSETGRPNYDVSPDGQRFVMVRSSDQSPTHLHVVHNWRALFNGARSDRQ